MLPGKRRQISKTTSGSPELPVTRTETAFPIECYRCGRDAEAREIEVTLAKSLGARDVKWVRVPDGWWVQGFVNFGLTAGCPGCMETPLEVAVASAATPKPECPGCGFP